MNNFFDQFYVLALLASLLLLIVAMFYLRLKKKLEKKSFIKIRESLAIGNKEKLMVIDCGDESILLGVTPNSINMLVELKHKYYNRTENKSAISKLVEKINKKNSFEQLLEERADA